MSTKPGQLQKGSGRFRNLWISSDASESPPDASGVSPLIRERPGVHQTGATPPAEATAQIEDWQILFPVIASTPGSLRLAMRAVEQHSLSFWDAMQWAVAKQANAALFLSEDLQHGRELEGVRFRNPFLAGDPFAPV